MNAGAEGLYSPAQSGQQRVRGDEQREGAASSRERGQAQRRLLTVASRSLLYARWLSLRGQRRGGREGSWWGGEMYAHTVSGQVSGAAVDGRADVGACMLADHCAHRNRSRVSRYTLRRRPMAERTHTRVAGEDGRSGSWERSSTQQRQRQRHLPCDGVSAAQRQPHSLTTSYTAATAQRCGSSGTTLRDEAAATRGWRELGQGAG